MAKPKNTAAFMALAVMLMPTTALCLKSTKAEDVPREEVTSVVVMSEPMRTADEPTSVMATPAEPPKTMYDSFIPHEIELLEKLVAHEVGLFSYENKKLIAEVLYNRLVFDDFPDDVYEMLHQPNQFGDVEHWSAAIDEETRRAVKHVFSGDPPQHNATFFYTPRFCSAEVCAWFENNLDFCFEHTEYLGEIEFTGRFFALKEDNNA